MTTHQITSINNWSDLQQMGINALTGEACAYSMRLLCDVNEEGAAALAEYLGIKPEGFAAPWNSRVADKPSVGSVMLTRDQLMPLAKFLLFRAGALAYATHGQGVIGIYDDEHLDAYKAAGFRAHYNPTIHSEASHVGSRAVHTMTGRAG